MRDANSAVVCTSQNSLSYGILGRGYCKVAIVVYYRTYLGGSSPEAFDRVQIYFFVIIIVSVGRCWNKDCRLGFLAFVRETQNGKRTRRRLKGNRSGTRHHRKGVRDNSRSGGDDC
jgi:hypothetical protein